MSSDQAGRLDQFRQRLDTIAMRELGGGRSDRDATAKQVELEQARLQLDRAGRNMASADSAAQRQQIAKVFDEFTRRVARLEDEPQKGQAKPS